MRSGSSEPVAESSRKQTSGIHNAVRQQPTRGIDELKSWTSGGTMPCCAVAMEELYARNCTLMQGTVSTSTTKSDSDIKRPARWAPPDLST